MLGQKLTTRNFGKNYYLNKNMRIALIWASNNPEKFWNKILKDLIGKWHQIIPINPREKTIEWIKCHTNLWVVSPLKYDIINFVVPAQITLQILKKYRKKILKKQIWCQPGASDLDVEIFLKNHNFKSYIVNSCIMLNNL